MQLTHHGAHRAKNRSISEQIIDLILNYGQSVRRRGANVFFLAKGGREKLRKVLGSKHFAALEPKLDAYVVVSDSGTIITVAYHDRRLKAG